MDSSDNTKFVGKNSVKQTWGNIIQKHILNREFPISPFWRPVAFRGRSSQVKQLGVRALGHVAASWSTKHRDSALA